MANIISGKSGTVKIGATAVADVAEWTMEAKVAANAHASNSTSGWKTRSAGTKDATGKLKIYLTDGAPTELVIGEKYSVELHIDDSGSNFYSGSILIESTGGMTVDFNDGKEISAEYSWGANGAIAGNGNVPLLAPSV